MTTRRDRPGPSAPEEQEQPPRAEERPEPDEEAYVEQPLARAGEAVAAPAEPVTGARLLELLDAHWAAFRALAEQFPRERIDEPLDPGWTRKQMLAHVTAWHDHTAERLNGYAKTGRPQALGVEIDSFNARAARAAVGRTSGEVVDALEQSFRRLRRLIGQLTDEQLNADRGWATAIIAANTYDHYAEHAPDLQPGDGAALSSAP